MQDQLGDIKTLLLRLLAAGERGAADGDSADIGRGKKAG